MNESGAAAELATQWKHLKYFNIKSRSTGMYLVVVGVETMGV